MDYSFEEFQKLLTIEISANTAPTYFEIIDIFVWL